MKRSKLKRRLRKKLRLGEFQELGFQVSLKFKPGQTEAEADEFWHEFVGQVDQRKLCFGGGTGTETWDVFVTAVENYRSPTAAQHEEIKSWLENRDEISVCEIGNLRDAWYDIG